MLYHSDWCRVTVEDIEWLLNGAVISRENPNERGEITLTLTEPEAGQGGHYSCAVFTDGEQQQVSAGFLIIYSEHFIQLVLLWLTRQGPWLMQLIPVCTMDG